MTGNISKMNVSKNSATATLVREIEAKVTEKGLTLSRWQTNGASHRVTITWAIHSGERTTQSGQQDGVIGKITLTALEGSTTRCSAYRSLSKLLAAVSNA